MDSSDLKNHYFYKYLLDLPLYGKAPITKLETLSMILNIHLIFGTKKELVKELLRFVNVIIGSLAIPETTFLLDQIFNSDRIEFFFFL